MKISFLEIAKGRDSLLVQNAAWVGNDACQVTDFVPVPLRFEYVDDCTVVVNGRIELSLVTACHRCGELTKIPVDTKFRYVIRVGEDLLQHEVEYECRDEDYETMYIDEPQFDTDELLYEQVQLAMPEKILCRQDCKGLCPVCGISLNEETCSCLADSERSPFAVLSKLKK